MAECGDAGPWCDLAPPTLSHGCCTQHGGGVAQATRFPREGLTAALREGLAERPDSRVQKLPPQSGSEFWIVSVATSAVSLTRCPHGPHSCKQRHQLCNP